MNLYTKYICWEGSISPFPSVLKLYNVTVTLGRTIFTDAATFLNVDVEDIHNFAAYYNLHLQEEELCVARNFIRAKQQKEKDTITSLKAIVQVALTIPVTSCSCERTFSTLRRLKTWLRARMADQRLDNMALLSIEKSTYACLSQHSWPCNQDAKYDLSKYDI